MEYQLIRSKRKTIGAEIKNGKLLVRAPKTASKKQIEKFLDEQSAWIMKHLEKAKIEKEKAEEEGPLTDLEIDVLMLEAKEAIPKRVAYYAPIVGVNPGRIKIRNQKTRWGSCSAKGNLNFNCLLMLAPPLVLDSVVVHELCHMIEMNHSKKFYDEVLRVFPEYKKCQKWLKENGNVLMMRMK